MMKKLYDDDRQALWSTIGTFEFSEQMGGDEKNIFPDNVYDCGNRTLLRGSQDFARRHND
jgi:hypothetical protein